MFLEVGEERCSGRHIAVEESERGRLLLISGVGAFGSGGDDLVDRKDVNKAALTPGERECGPSAEFV